MQLRASAGRHTWSRRDSSPTTTTHEVTTTTTTTTGFTIPRLDAANLDPEQLVESCLHEGETLQAGGALSDGPFCEVAGRPRAGCNAARGFSQRPCGHVLHQLRPQRPRGQRVPTAKKERGERLCLTCGKSGHEARNCPDKGATAPRQHARLVANAKPAGKAAAFAITAKDSEGCTSVTKGPRRQEIQLGDLIANNDRQQQRPIDNNNKDNNSRFRPLTSPTARCQG